MTLIEGDGIGPEISQSVKDIFAAAKARQSASPAYYEYDLLNSVGPHKMGTG